MKQLYLARDMGTKRQQHFTASLESVVVSQEGLFAALRSLFGKEKDMEKEARLTIDQLKATFANPQWLGHQNFRQGLLSRKGITPYLTPVSDPAKLAQALHDHLTAVKQNHAQTWQLISQFNQKLNKLVDDTNKIDDPIAAGKHFQAGLNAIPHPVANYHCTGRLLSGVSIQIQDDRGYPQRQFKWGDSSVYARAHPGKDFQVQALDAKQCADVAKALIEILQTIEDFDYSSNIDHWIYDEDSDEAIELYEKLMDSDLNDPETLWNNVFHYAGREATRESVPNDFYESLFNVGIATERWLKASVGTTASLESLTEQTTVSMEGFLGRLFTRGPDTLLPGVGAKYKHAIENIRRDYKTQYTNPTWVKMRGATGEEIRYPHAIKSLSKFGHVPENVVQAIDHHVQTAFKFAKDYIALIHKGDEAAVRKFHPNLDDLLNDQIVPSLVGDRAGRKAERIKRDKRPQDALPALTETQCVVLAQRNLKLVDDYVELKGMVDSVAHADIGDFQEDFSPQEILSRLLYTLDAIQGSVHYWISHSIR